MAASLVIRQQIAQRPGASHYDSHPRELKFAKGSLLSFALHSTSYEDDAAVIRIPPGVKLCLSTACVGRKEWEEFTRTSSARAVVLKFSSEENGEMLALWTHDRDRSGDVCQTGLGVEVEGPRTVRLAAVVDRGFKKGSPLDVNVFGSVRKGGL